MIHSGDMMMLSIEETNIRGCGVSRVEDMVIFCKDAVCGDTVIAFVEEVKKNYALAKALKVVSPSKHRSTAVCPHFTRCGGCAFGHVTYGHESQIKRDSISAALRRCAGINACASTIITGAELGYRNKAVFHFDSQKNAGFYRHGSRELVVIEDCEICHPVIMEIKKAAESVLKETPSLLPQELTYLYIRYMAETEEASVVLGYTGSTSLLPFAKKLSDAFPCIKCIMKGKAENPEAKDEEYQLILGNDFIRDVFCSMDIRVSPRSFYQVNRENAEKMCLYAARLAELGEGDVCLDLYCGAGTIGMTVAKHFPTAKVYGVEINSKAVINAKENAKRNSLSNVEFFCGDSKDFADKTGVSKADCIIVDPPRAGLSKKTVSEILRFAPNKLIYVSCNPDTLARDLKILSEHYDIAEISGVDLFPKTAHCEVVVLLSRKDVHE